MSTATDPHTKPPRAITLATAALPFAAAALLLAACGSSSTPAGQRSAHGDVINSSAVAQRPLPGTGGNAINDDNPGRADSGRQGAAGGQVNPCTLVSKTQAQAIIGRPIAAPREAPLGPTCIYQPLGAGESVTLVIESVDFAKVKPHMRNRIQVAVGSLTAYCGDYGRPTTFVPLANDRVLNIAAPCAIGTRFAAGAIPRLKTSSS